MFPGFLTLFKKTLLLAFLGLVLVAASALAAFSEPASNPPQGNATGVIDTSSSPQAKDGGFSADNITGAIFSFGGVAPSIAKWYADSSDSNRLTFKTQKYCLPGTAPSGGCITAWPASSGNTQTCTLERTVVKDISVDGYAAYGDVCQSYLSATSVDAGWTATGSDTCPSTGADNCDHGYPALQCYYMRITCS